MFNKQLWLAFALILEKWVANCIFDNTFPKQGQVKLETVSSYLFDLKSYHIEQQLSLESFNNPQMALIMNESRKLFLSKKQNRLPITKDVFTNITKINQQLLMISALKWRLKLFR